jgi:putative spermidine/putrescine transport system permease protein
MKKSSWRFWCLFAFTCAVAGFLVLPVLLSILAGLTENYLVGWSSGLTLKWVTKVWADYQSSIWRSIAIACATLIVVALLGVPLAYVLHRLASSRAWLARLIEELLMLPVALPGIATALALIVLYGAVGNLRSSWVFILIGHVLFTLPFMVRSVLAVMASIDLHTLEEGARSLGANFWQRLFTIVLPNCAPGVLAGALMCLTLSVGEFNLTLLLHTPFTQTLPVGLADAYASLRIEVASAYTVVFFAMIVPLLVALQWANQHLEKKR